MGGIQIRNGEGKKEGREKSSQGGRAEVLIYSRGVLWNSNKLSLWKSFQPSRIYYVISKHSFERDK